MVWYDGTFTLCAATQQQHFQEQYDDILSAANKGNVLDRNVEIAASGSKVLDTWWTNKTGVLMPVFKASNDNGDTFGKTMTLNSTSTP